MKNLSRASGAMTLMTLACLCGNPANAGPLYTVTTIDGPNPGLGGELTSIQGISDKHILVGFAFPNDPCTYSFLYDGTTFSAIQPPAPFSPECVRAMGVNNDGKIVGTYGDAVQGDGFLLHNGVYSNIGAVQLPPWPGPRTLPQGISNSGLIVGNYIDSIGNHGFVDIGGSFDYFNVPGAQDTFAQGINDIGEVAGNFVDSTGTHGYVDFWGLIKRLDFPGAQQTAANGVNDLSTVVGSYTDSSSQQHGFIYTSAGFTTFDVPGGSDTQLTGINNRGQIVGSYDLHGFRADPKSLILVTGQVRLNKPLIQVTIPSTAQFDASTINTASLTFGHLGTEPSLAACQVLPGAHGVACTFSTSASALQCGDTQATLVGQLIDGTPIRGSDVIHIAGCN